MKIEIKNCNNIDQAAVTIEQNCLNIKYAQNGTGKSTIAHALAAFVNNDEEAKAKLLPFKYKNMPLAHAPSVTGIDNIKSVKIFDEDYVNRFVFTPAELFPNAFNVFVKTETYDKHMANINAYLAKIRTLFAENKRINDLLRKLESFIGGFGRSAKELSKVCPIAKGIAKGNPVANIPKGLECFAIYIRSQRQNDWIKWHSEGDDLATLQKDSCPYCAQSLAEVSERVDLVSKKYDANSVKHLVSMVGIFKELASDGLAATSAEFVNAVTANAEGIKEEDAKHLMEIKKQVDVLVGKLRGLQSVNFYSMKDDPKRIAERLNQLRLDVAQFPELQSEKVDVIVKEVNASIDFALTSVEKLEEEVVAQQNSIAEEVREYNGHINAFMELAGYPYRVEISDLGDGRCQTRLCHIDLPNLEVENAKEHLSYGEKNAFALSLFVYDAISSRPDLVVLDDPISSFDGNKKFALLKMMFWDKGWKTLSGQTVLMLTHDFCPVIDIKRTFAKDFPGTPYAWYTWCANGIVQEKEIKKNDVQSALKINARNAGDKQKDVLLRIVYYRKWLELKGEMGGTAYDVASNLEHLRQTPQCYTGNGYVDMPKDGIKKGEQEIGNRINGFDYAKEQKRAMNKVTLKTLYQSATSNFDKILAFRYVTVLYAQQKKQEPDLESIVQKIYERTVSYRERLYLPVGSARV